MRSAADVTHSPSEVIRLLAEHGIEPSRALGQNFVADANTVRRIARLAQVGEGDRVVEIGAGLGSLTLALLERGASVVAVEVDRHLLPPLRSIVEPRGAVVVAADALHIDWDAALGPPELAAPWILVANLPYNIATILVLELLEHVPQIERLVVLVQAEVGERLAAGPGSRTYGIPSVKAAWWAHASILGRVPPSVFVPPPRVESALVELRRRTPPGDDRDRAAVFALVETAFGQRRKMLRRSLVDTVPWTAFDAADIRPDARPEELSLDDWRRLAAVLPASA
jgi:16S rRNA (adenine1518-N6/adenine1519-N6)-dimethyltransferase